MKLLYDYDPYRPILAKTNLLNHIPEEHFASVLSYLNASIRSYEKDELIQRLGEPLRHSGIVLDGTVEGSFISETYNKINMNHFSTGHSFAEALACVQTEHSPIQLRALTACSVIFFDLSRLISDEECLCSDQPTLSKNLIKILASQTVFSNLKLRIANQKALRDRILMYLYSLKPDADGCVHIPFTQTALAEFLGVNRSALSRELGHMQDESLIRMNGKQILLLKK